MKILRKDFIKLSGTGIAAIAGLSIAAASGCSGIRREDIAESESGIELKKLLGEDRYAVLSYASLAPSPHNTQPWYVKFINKDKWIVCADQSRSMKATDPDNYRLIISLGIFTENLSLAAGALGYDTEITVVSKNFFSDDILQIRFIKSDLSGFPLERITTRKTLNGFQNKIISDDHLNRLSESLKGHFFFFPFGTIHGDCIKKDTVTAFREWLSSEEAQAEHVRWIRISNSEAKQKRDGLTTEGMEIKGFTADGQLMLKMVGYRFIV